MRNIYPDYFDQFHCLADRCPDNCCKGWQVVVDEETAVRYRLQEGETGETLRAALETDQDGDLVLRHKGGICCLQTKEGLCQAQLALGPEALCRVCREFPRLCQDFTGFREYGLSLACPEAARLILTAPHLPQHTAFEEASGELPDYSPEDMAFLQNIRRKMLAILQNPLLSAPQRIALCLLLAEHAQQQLDGNPMPEFSREAALIRFEQAAAGNTNWREIIGFYQNLEILTPAWAKLLDSALEDVPTFDPLAAHPQEFINLFWCELYRTLLCAVADFDLLGRVQSAVLTCAVGRHLIGLAGDSQAARLHIHWLYAKEISHDAENRDALLDACWEKPFLSVEALLSLLR